MRHPKLVCCSKPGGWGCAAQSVQCDAASAHCIHTRQTEATTTQMHCITNMLRAHYWAITICSILEVQQKILHQSNTVGHCKCAQQAQALHASGRAWSRKVPGMSCLRIKQRAGLCRSPAWRCRSRGLGCARCRCSRCRPSTATTCSSRSSSPGPRACGHTCQRTPL